MLSSAFAICTYSIYGETFESYLKIGITMSSIKLSCTLTMLVVSLLHMWETYIPAAFSISPWLKNSLNYSSTQYMLVSKSLIGLLNWQQCNITFDISCLLFSSSRALDLSINLSLFLPFSIPNFYKCSVNYFRRSPIVNLISVDKIASTIRFLINLISDYLKWPLRKSHSVYSSKQSVWAAWLFSCVLYSPYIWNSIDSVALWYGLVNPSCWISMQNAAIRRAIKSRWSNWAYYYTCWAFKIKWQCWAISEACRSLWYETLFKLYWSETFSKNARNLWLSTYLSKLFYLNNMIASNGI